MNIHTEHCIDKGEEKEDGTYGYFYEYDMYQFSDDTCTYFVRSYTDTPEEAIFLKKLLKDKESELVSKTDFTQPLFIEVYTFLKEQGKKHIEFFDSTNKESGYTTVEL